jgi:Na+/H+-dicarboxylate symporter
MKDIGSGGFLKNYKGIMLLLGGILAGSVLGLVLVKRWRFETFGRHFLNLLFTAIIPLVFFYHIGINCYFRKKNRTRKVILNRNWSLLFTVLVSAIMVVGVLIFQSIKILSFLKFR